MLCCTVICCSVMANSLWPHGLQPSRLLFLQARVLEWVAVPSSRRSSQPGDRTQVSTAGDSFQSEPPGKSKKYLYCVLKYIFKKEKTWYAKWREKNVGFTLKTEKSIVLLWMWGKCHCGWNQRKIKAYVEDAKMDRPRHILEDFEGHGKKWSLYSTCNVKQSSHFSK